MWGSAVRSPSLLERGAQRIVWTLQPGLEGVHSIVTPPLARTHHLDPPEAAGGQKALSSCVPVMCAHEESEGFGEHV